MVRKNIDSTVDFGTADRGLNRTEGLCNYQWAMTGPLGSVIFYCTESEGCSGDPHSVNFSGDRPEDHAYIEWTNAEDLRIRREAQS